LVDLVYLVYLVRSFATPKASGKLRVVKKKPSNPFNEREILLYRHANNLHVVLDNKEPRLQGGALKP
jgi:hypothetical protein